MCLVLWRYQFSAINDNVKCNKDLCLRYCTVNQQSKQERQLYPAAATGRIILLSDKMWRWKLTSDSEWRDILSKCGRAKQRPDPKIKMWTAQFALVQKHFLYLTSTFNWNLSHQSTDKTTEHMNTLAKSVKEEICNEVIKSELPSADTHTQRNSLMVVKMRLSVPVYQRTDKLLSIRMWHL